MNNIRYGRIEILEDGSNYVVYADKGGMYAGRLFPTYPEWIQRSLGYLPIVDEVPSETPPGGYHWEARGWAEVEPQTNADAASPTPAGTQNGADALQYAQVSSSYIRRVYEAVQDPPPPPRRWSRLSIKTALAQAEILAAVRTFLGSVEIATGYTAWEALADCDYIEEGYPDATKWNAILDGAAQALGKTRAEIDAFLAQIPTEGGV